MISLPSSCIEARLDAFCSGIFPFGLRGFAFVYTCSVVSHLSLQSGVWICIISAKDETSLCKSQKHRRAPFEICTDEVSFCDDRPLCWPLSEPAPKRSKQSIAAGSSDDPPKNDGPRQSNSQKQRSVPLKMSPCRSSHSDRGRAKFSARCLFACPERSGLALVY